MNNKMNDRLTDTQYKELLGIYIKGMVCGGPKARTSHQTIMDMRHGIEKFVRIHGNVSKHDFLTDLMDCDEYKS